MQGRLRRPHTAAAILLAVGLVLAGCAVDTPASSNPPDQPSAAFPDATTTQLKDAVKSAMAATGSSGAVVGVWAPWSGSWVGGVGTQHPGGGGSVSADMEFRAGKITRAMTCDVLYAVAGKHLVSLDDSVSKYVSGVPEATSITLQQLCDGTSGIGSYAPELLPLWLTNPSRVWDPRELAGYGLGQNPTGAPGAAYADSDAGYVLLGLALERATGKSAADLLSQYVTGPLDLSSTELPPDTQLLPATNGPVLRGLVSMKGAKGLECTDPTDITKLSPSVGYTDSGVVSTIADLGRYGRALATGVLLHNAEKRFAQPMAAYANAPAWLTAAGGAIHAGSLIGQYGSIPGYLSAVFSDPDTGLTVAVVLNNSAAPGTMAAYLAWELAAIASKAPAAAHQKAPEAGLPWTAQQFHDAIAKAAVCPLPAQ